MSVGGPRRVTSTPLDPLNDVSIPSWDAVRSAQFEERTAKLGPREWLVTALDRWCPRPATPGSSALDFGCGPGKECQVLLERGWRVMALDASARMLTLTLERARSIGAESRLELVHGPFERTELPRGRFEVIHAGMALPFASAADFARVWRGLVNALLPGGLFVGQLCGPDDSFVCESPPGSMSAHDAAEVTRLLSGFEVLAREEVNRPGEMTRGSSKHWHVHHLVARRLTGSSPPRG